jgi:thiamine biosynthesis lipoprotein
VTVSLHAFAAMGTVVSLRVVVRGETSAQKLERERLVAGAVGWFRAVEEVCSRFDPGSELSRLSGRIGQPVRVSELLYRATEFALALAAETRGAFDPTVGRRMEAHGFNRSWISGEVVDSKLPADESTSYRDVILDAENQTITLTRPLLLDLGAVAKGLAIDLAARELAPLQDFSVDAGGDLFLGGVDDEGEPWLVGIRHPRQDGAIAETLRVSGAAVCTSGDYERRNSAGAHHVLDPRTGTAAALAASVSVVAPSAMVADGLATAAMVLGPAKGLELIETQGVEGVVFTADMQRFTSAGIERYAASNLANSIA